MPSGYVRWHAGRETGREQVIIWDARWVDAGPLRLFSESAGAGDDTVLLVMGTSAAGFGWPDALVERILRTGRRVIRFDHRDTGRSSTVDIATDPYTVDDMAADASAVLDAWGAAAAHVVGLSLGGTIAQWLAVNTPGRVNSAILLCSSPMDVDAGPAIASALAGRPAPPGTLPPPTPAFLQYLTERAAGAHDAGAADPEAESITMWSLLAGTQRPFDRVTAQRFVRDTLALATSPTRASQHDVAGRVMTAARTRPIEHIACPTLVVHGSADPILPPEHGQALMERIPEARGHVLPGVGHGLFTIGLPAEIGSLIVEHLDRVRKPDPES